jgi:hypothetical protein
MRYHARRTISDTAMSGEQVAELVLVVLRPHRYFPVKHIGPEYTRPRAPLCEDGLCSIRSHVQHLGL